MTKNDHILNLMTKEQDEGLNMVDVLITIFNVNLTSRTTYATFY